MDKSKKLSVRQAFHKQGNLHQIAIINALTAREYFKIILEQEDIPEKTKQAAQKCLKSLDRAEKVTLEADYLRKSLKDIVYAKFDPDEIMIDIETREE